MSCLNKNLALFMKMAPGVYQKIVNYNEENDYGVKVYSHWDNNKRLIKVQKEGKEIWLGSTFNTKREMERLLEKYNKNSSLIMVLGIGNYKLFRAIKEYFVHLDRLIIVEPSIEIMKTFIENVSVKDIFSIFGKTNISFILGSDLDEVKNYYVAYSLSYIKDNGSLVYSIAYEQLFSNVLIALKQYYSENLVSKNVSLNTIKKFKYVWLTNRWKNLEKRSVEANCLIPLMQKKTVIIVSAGPSLEKNMHLLKNVGNKAIIIAAGSAIQILHRNGIIPHLRAAFDSSALQERIFDGLNGDDCPLIYTPNLNFQVLKNYGDKTIKFFSYGSDYLSEYLYNVINRTYQSVSTGVSISNTVAFLALFLGCKKIILLGQDLCYTDNKMHAEGTWETKSENLRHLKTSNVFLTKDIYGNDVYTDPVLTTMKNTFEDTARNYKNCEFINASEGGLRLDGFLNKRFSEVLESDLPNNDLVDIRDYLDDQINSYKESPNSTIFEQEIKVATGALYSEMKKLRKLVIDLACLIELGVEDKKIKKIKILYEKICDNSCYKYYMKNVLATEELAVTTSIGQKKLDVREKAFLEFVKEAKDYLDYSIIYAESFLKGEQNYDITLEI